MFGIVFAEFAYTVITYKLVCMSCASNDFFLKKMKLVPTLLESSGLLYRLGKYTVLLYVRLQAFMLVHYYFRGT